MSSETESKLHLQSETSKNQCRSFIPVLIKSSKSHKRNLGIESESTSTSNTEITNKRGKLRTNTSVPHNNLNNRGEVLNSDRSEPGPSRVNLKTSPKSKSKRKTKNFIDFLHIESESTINIEQNLIKPKKHYLRHNNKRIDSPSGELNLNTNIVTKTSDNTALNGVVPAIKHKYTLRSQGKVSEITKKQEQTGRNWQPSSALGASTSQTSKREDAVPSRLTRTGAVLRRSTRNTKCKFFFLFFLLLFFNKQ